MTIEFLMSAAATLGVELDSTTLGRFDLLLQRLQQSNRHVNLSAVRDAEGIVRRHFLESLALGNCLARRGLLSDRESVLDLGSGAGFPGLPLKLAWTGIELTCVEATQKKARFIAEAADALSLRDVNVQTRRAEDLARDPAFRETQDVVVARAVAALPSLVELALPFLRIDGTFAAVKGSRWQDELRASREALGLCGGQFVSREPLSGSDDLAVLLIRKSAPTPDRYPRRSGQPVAHPLRGH